MTPGAFLPDRDPSFYLLRAHRQPLAANVARAYIEQFTAPGDLVVDPFAASATAARVAVESGRRAIAVESNPLVAFAARLQASPPPPREISVALARWGEVLKEAARLQTHIEQLYASVCAECGDPVIVDYFIHTRELEAPVEKIYQCVTHGSRRDPTNEADRARAAEFQPKGFHYHLIFERIAGRENPHANILRELLKLYTPRNLYALVTLTLKLDTEFRDDPAREILLACLLHALDVGTTLYTTPDALPEREPPEKFVEVNIWRALQTAARGLSEPSALPKLKSAEEVARSRDPAMYVGQGSAHSLLETLGEDTRAALVLSSPARLDPTFWQLSYLWTRWLLGKAASRALEPFLDEKRQRWGWYGSALTTSLNDAAQLIEPEGRAVFAFPAGSHAMIEAVCLAASPVFELQAFAFRPHRGAQATSEFGAVRGDYRVVWSRRESDGMSKPAREVAQDLRRGALAAATNILAARGEPLAYSWLHHSALSQLAREKKLAETLAARLPGRDNAFQFLRREIEAGLKEGYASDLDHWREEGRVLWVRRQSAREFSPLPDRVEQAAREILAETPSLRRVDFDERILSRFPELLTPEIELVELCASAYADLIGDEWHWRQVDVAGELVQARELVKELGERLEFKIGAATQPFDLVWLDEKIVPASSGGELKQASVYEDSHVFLFRPRVDVRALARTRARPLRGVVIVPESQVALTRERLRRAPTLLKPLADAGWEFLRVPFIEMLLASTRPQRAEFALALGLEPALVQGKEQMELF